MTTNEMQQNIEELNKLRVQNRRWRIATALVSVVIITTGLIILKVSATNLLSPGPKRDAFVAELQRSMSAEVIPHVKERATATMNHLVPVVKSEVLRLELRAPEVVDAVTDQLQLLNDNLPARAEKILDTTLTQMIRDHVTKFKATYPEMKEEEIVTLTDALLQESQRRALKVSDTITAPYMHTFQQITDELSTIRQTEITTFPKDASALDLAMVLIDIMRQEIKETAPNDPNWTLLSTILAQAK